MDGKIAKIGFEEENYQMPIILLDRKARKMLGVKINEIVMVRNKSEERFLPAVVMPQFKDMIGMGFTVNGYLATMLKVKVGDMIEAKDLWNYAGVSRVFGGEKPNLN